MTDEQSRVTTHVQRFLEGRPIDWVIVCGSGLGSALADAAGPLGLVDRREVSLADLGLPAPKVAGHGQALVWGRVGDRAVCLQTGRLHPYEGHAIATCVAALRAMILAGPQRPHVLLTAATGALRPQLQSGQLVALRDQLNLFGPTPLVGPEFIDCSQLYDSGLRERLHRAAHEARTSLVDGVYAHARGPQYETPAEVAALRLLGGDVVGMSTTYEAVAARALDAKIAGLALVTNTAADVGLDHADVQRTSRAAHQALGAVIGGLVRDDTATSP
ncbi:MAG: purine-nucleoside phosphorylase [Myxococcales bacterium FL481]|nr:MAG: purine-nucleoside phosphorylase [Myxococcales bacterium FL481]